jgi:hypothetical protein
MSPELLKLTPEISGTRRDPFNIKELMSFYPKGLSARVVVHYNFHATVNANSELTVILTTGKWMF